MRGTYTTSAIDLLVDVIDRGGEANGQGLISPQPQSKPPKSKSNQTKPKPKPKP